MTSVTAPIAWSQDQIEHVSCKNLLDHPGDYECLTRM